VQRLEQGTETPPKRCGVDAVAGWNLGRLSFTFYNFIPQAYAEK
jgi:hypothetical protein